MTARLTPIAFSAQFPRVSRLVGEANLAERIDELDEPDPRLVRQIDEDLGFLAQRATEEQVSAAYRNLFRNPRLFRSPRELLPVLYELRAAAMLASVSRQVGLAPRVGSRRADLMCVIGTSRIFVEATTLIERWPPPSRLDSIVWCIRPRNSSVRRVRAGSS